MTFKRIVAGVLASALTLSVVLVPETISKLLPFQITSQEVMAYENIAEYPDFSMDIYVAELMAGCGSNADRAVYKRLDYYINSSELPSSYLYKRLNENKNFAASAEAWKDATFDLTKVDDQTFGQVELYETIILQILKCNQEKGLLEKYVKKATKDFSYVYKYAKKSMEIEYAINFDFDNIEWDKLTDVEKGDVKGAFEKSFKKAFPELKDMDDFLKKFNTMLNAGIKIEKALSTVIAYKNCYDFTEDLKKLVEDLYKQCDSWENPYMKAALNNINNACKDDILFTSLEQLFELPAEIGYGIFEAAADGFVKSVISSSAFGKGVLIGQFIGKTVSNWLFSTDQTIEQYYKMEALLNFETLLRSVTNYEMEEFRNNETVENANVLFSAVELFFSTYSISCDFGNKYLKILYKDGLVNKIFGNDEKYNQLTGQINDLNSMAKDAHDDITKNLYPMYLKDDYPEIYEAMIGEYGAEGNIAQTVPVTGIEFLTSDVEVHLGDISVNSVIVSPSNATNTDIIYTSSAPSIAEFKGFVLSTYKEGTATITATSVDGGFTTVMNVTVLPPRNETTDPDNPDTPVEPDNPNTPVKPDIPVEEKIRIGEIFEYDDCTYKVTSIDELTISLIDCDNSKEGVVKISESLAYKGKIFNITSLGGGAFEGCSNLTSITIPDSVTSIGDSAFENCSSLTSITIPNSVTSIGKSAFDYCKSLHSIIIPNSVTSIDDNAFRSCSSLTSITIPNSVTSIGEFAFAFCSSLTSISIPDSVTSIGDSAFKNCSSFTSITIPDSVTSIGNCSFYDCKNLVSITIPVNITWIDFFEGCSNLTNITISGSATSIGDGAFENCSSLTNITISGSVTSIGDSAFENCSNLTNITIPDSVTIIEEDAFYGCSNLTNIKISENVTNIGYCTFSNCSSLASITIPDSVTSIDDSAFRNCSSLTSITIPNSVTSIGEFAFAGCSNLTNIKISDNVTNIGYGTFSNCSSLASITIPDSVTSIGIFAFAGCSNLTNITIPDSVTSIEEDAFYGCSSFKNITIPDNVISIGNYAFGHCSNLESITILNPECEIYDANRTICNGEDYIYGYGYGYITYFDGIIYGYENSTAQEYAEKFWYKFVAIGSEEVIHTLDGDSNGDGTVNVSDAVVLQKFLLGTGNLTNWKNADLCKDGKIDVFDMVEMRKLLIKNK